MNRLIAEQLQRCVDARVPTWRALCRLHMRLAYADRIGRHRDDPSRTPGIWGRSYVRTYYEWVQQTPQVSARSEGGIATSFFVYRALVAAHRVTRTQIDSGVTQELGEFLARRTSANGEIGVYSADHRGDVRVLKNLRHTCLGFLLSQDALGDGSGLETFEQTCSSAASYIGADRDWKELLQALFDETWPIGGLASYIAARDAVFDSRRHVEQAAVVWPDVRRDLIQALAHMKSGTLRQLREGARADRHGPLQEHYPYWHPIMGLSALRLHSTLGCLHLVGREIVRSGTGRQRVEQIVQCVIAELMDSHDRAPRFSVGHPESIAAAMAMLDVMTGDWFDDWFVPPTGFDECLRSLTDFCVTRWSDSSVYVDYWSEFCVPVTANQLMPLVVLDTQSESSLTGLEGLFSGLGGAVEEDEGTWNAVATVAIGTAPP